MEVSELQSHLKLYKSTYIANLQGGSYQMSPILGVEILKDNGKARLLGIPTVIDRLFQQALHQVLQPIFEQEFQR